MFFPVFVNFHKIKELRLAFWWPMCWRYFSVNSFVDLTLLMPGPVESLSDNGSFLYYGFFGLFLP